MGATLGQYWADGSAEHRGVPRAYLELDGLRAQYLFKSAIPGWVDPDNRVIDKALINRLGVDEIIFDPLYDIRNNVPTLQGDGESVRDRRPPAAGYHALDTGHFALDDKADEIAGLMRDSTGLSGVRPETAAENPGLLALGRGDHRRVAANRRAPASTLTRTNPSFASQEGESPGSWNPRLPGPPAEPPSYPNARHD